VTAFDPESVELPDVPGFRVIAAAGAGSRGVVFRARDLATQDLVALKVLGRACVAGLVDSPGAGDRASDLDAARRSLGDLVAHLATIDAPGLVRPRRVVEVPRGSEEDGPALAFAMEFVDGDSLARALQRNVRFAPARAAAILRDAAGALRSARASGFVHGGLHPGKVLIGRSDARAGSDDEVRVLGTGLGETLPNDFVPAEVSGRTSPHVYAADEVLAGDRATEASDVFSLGAVLYHLLTGLPPYKSRGLGALKVERADGPLIWPRGAMDELPPKLVKLVDRMTAAAPSRRPGLDHALLAELASAPKSRRIYRTPAFGGMSARGSGTRVEPPGDVAPLAHPAHAPEGEGLLRRAASGIVAFLRKPSAAAVVIGGATVVFILALAVALRRPPVPVEGDGHPAARGSDRAPQVDEAPGPARARAAPSPPVVVPAPAAAAVPDPDLSELEAVEQAFEANPGDAEAYRTRLEEFAGRPGDLGVRATTLLAGLDRHRERRAEKELAALLDRAAALEAAGRYGAVLALLKGFPHDRFGGTAASTRARVETEAVLRRAGEAFDRAERRVRDHLIAGDYVGARAEYESVKVACGLPDIVERAEEGLRRVGRLEEEEAAAAAKRRARVQVDAVRKGIRSAIADLARLCRTFRYTEAQKRVAEELRKVDRARDGLPRGEAERLAPDRELLDDYGTLIRWEAEHFRRVAERIRTGEKVGLVGFLGSETSFAIRAISERGLTVTEGEGELEFLWNHVPDKSAFALMEPEGDYELSLVERLAVAVFAHHRGLTEERDHELHMAVQLARTPALKTKVREVAEILDLLTPQP
jgi:hypothetical protein